MNIFKKAFEDIFETKKEKEEVLKKKVTFDERKH
jgi:hypothetical protein